MQLRDAAGLWSVIRLFKVNLHHAFRKKTYTSASIAYQVIAKTKKKSSA